MCFYKLKYIFDDLSKWKHKSILFVSLSKRYEQIYDFAVTTLCWIFESGNKIVSKNYAKSEINLITIRLKYHS